VLAPPRIGRGATTLVDAALLAALLVIAAQLVPLPPGVRLAVAASTVAYDQAVHIVPVGESAAVRGGPISVNPNATAFALFIDAVVVALFWSARRAFSRGGIRTAARGVAWMGVVVAPLAIAQHLTAPPLFYWEIRPLAENALPFTPFVNRNDFAGWLVMAIPLTLGYGIARMESRRHPGQPFDPEAAFDTKALLLGLSLFAMTAALLASLSRSGIAGATAALLFFVLLARRRMSRRRITWMIVGLAAMVALATMYANMGALGSRLGGAVSEGVAGRVAIWRQTWPMVQDFWRAGSGVGTYQQVMVLYQTTSRLFYISHADNEYLQMLAEGGVLLAIPVACALVAGAIAIARSLRTDRTPLFWVRIGAASGILGFAVQNVWEMTLRVPANGVLFAILAATAMHGSSNERTG
jgi:O-antigen ligase